MSGRITAISGPTVRVDLAGLRLYDRVMVGLAQLTGEVVRLDRNGAIIQVYEDTRGLGVGEPVAATGKPLTVSLGPGLLGGMFDGLQRPLDRIMELAGPFLSAGGDMPALDPSRMWRFAPLRRPGDEIGPFEPAGFVEEGTFRHTILFRGKHKERIAGFHTGFLSAPDPHVALENGSFIPCCFEWPVRAPLPYRRKIPSGEPLVTGQRSIDFLFSIARGGTAILPGGFGTGKTVLEQAIAKFADVDIVVYVGCGERGNEMAEMIEEFKTLRDPWTGRPLMERTILIVNTSNMPVAARESSIYTAVTMAEYYRDMGFHVLFLADSLSRWAEALREISSALEEMPGEEGYPTYLASRLSAFIERAGVVETLSGATGSLSMVLSVSPPGGDFTEPVTQACMRAAGAFLMLDAGLAHRRHFPAINWFQSYSLYAEDMAGKYAGRISAEWEAMRRWCGETLKREEALREVAEIVGVEGLQDTDRLIMRAAEMIRTEFLSQNSFSDDAFSSPEKTFAAIRRIRDFHERAAARLRQGAALEEILKEETP